LTSWAWRALMKGFNGGLVIAVVCGIAIA